MRPGRGWTQLGQGVWEHSSGGRIHVLGEVILLPDKTYPKRDCTRLWFLTKANGGNKKRGLMALYVETLANRTTVGTER